jgi:uncharacterized coiled-coil protein SlyX
MAAGALITAVAGAAVLLINALAKSRREDRQSDRADRESRATAEQIVIARQEKQIARLERVLDEHQTVLNRIVERHADCREETAQLRTWAEGVIERFRECSENCEKGRKLPTVPPLPPPRRRAPGEETGYLARTAAQDVELARGVGERMREGKADAGGET